MRGLAILAGALLLASAGEAKEVRRLGPAESPIAASAEVPAGSRLVYISGSVPDAGRSVGAGRLGAALRRHRGPDAVACCARSRRS